MPTLAQFSPVLADKLSALSSFRLRPVPKNPLPLLRTTPCSFAGFVTARTGALYKWASPIRCYAELRGDALLLYPVGDLLQNGEEIGGVKEVEELDREEVSRLTVAVEWKRVLTFVLPVTSIMIREEEAQIVLRMGRRMSSTALCFEGREDVGKWRAAFARGMEMKGKTLSDFEIVSHIGRGASANVFLVEEKDSRERYALKVIDKATVFESSDAYNHALDERLALAKTRAHPFVLDMKYAFQNGRRLFLITEFCPGGDLFDFMERRVTAMSERMARGVAAEVLLALEHIHGFGIVYRDLKLENILLDEDGHVRIADFGLAKLLKSETGELKRARTFCGTREYVAPEMISGKEYDMTLDLWTFGVLVYELLTGATPFYTKEHNLIYSRIEKAPVFYPQDMSKEARDLVEKLLKRVPSERLGAKEGFDEIKRHVWFKDVDWEELRWSPPEEGPLFVNSDQMRTMKDMSERITPTARAVVRKSRREVRADRAMASLLEDVKEDLVCVTGNRERVSAFVGAEASPVVSSKPNTPSLRKGVVMAGYSFCSD